ncbi:hypothetical protein QT971_14400 [Microcoleus sp. herbarium19]|mgnify:CR=1 FL=1
MIFVDYFCNKPARDGGGTLRLVAVSLFWGVSTKLAHYIFLSEGFKLGFNPFKLFNTIKRVQSFSTPTTNIGANFKHYYLSATFNLMINFLFNYLPRTIGAALKG